VEFAASDRLPLLEVVRVRIPPRRRNARKHALLINGRPRLSSRARASSAYDSQFEGDSAAYHLLLERLTSHLRAYYKQHFARIGDSPTETEDLLQEALIAVHTHRHTYDRSQPFTPWIYAIARYKLLDYLRRTKSSFKDLPMESVQELMADSEMTAVDSGLDLQRLLSRISPRAREAIQCVKLKGLSVSEAAARSGMSESAVKVAVHRGLKALALRIRQERAS
jgi:RNA polymerase sigma-70 factor, ECF subfamily